MSRLQSLCAPAIAAAIAAALPGLASAAHAQSTVADSARADSVRADSLRRVGMRAGQLRAVVVVGSRLSATAAAPTPARVSVARVGDVAGGPAPAAGLIAGLPGVSAFDDQGTRAQPTLDVRGFTLSPVVGVGQGVSVFLDGVRINEGDAQQVNFDLIPAEAVERAELTRGPSALFGKNTLAGALNLTTRRGDGVPTLALSADGGAYGYRGATLSASGEHEGIDGFLLARGSREDGWRSATGARRQLLFGTLGRRSADADVALSLLVAHDSIAQAGSLPEALLATDPRANYTSGDFVAPRLAYAALRGRRAALGGELRGNLFGRRNATEQFNVNADAPSTRAFVRTVSAGGAAEWTTLARGAGVPLAVTLGAEAVGHRVRYRVYHEAAAGVTDESGCLPDEACEDARVHESDAAAYAQVVAAPDGPLSATLSARADYVRVPFDDRRDPEHSATSTFRRLSPQLGVAWAPSRRLRAYASAGAGFRAPAALELACASADSPCPLPFSLGDDPPLAPVRALNVEAGADWAPLSRLRLGVSVFRTGVRDEIVLVAAERTAGYFQNFSRTRRAGVELQGEAALAGGVSLFGTYAAVAATYQGSARLASAREDADVVEPGDRLPLSPVHRVRAGVRATRLVRGVAIGGELSGTVVSSAYLRGDEANETPPLPGYGTGALRLTADHTHVGIALDVTNLFDRRYVTFGTYAPSPAGDGSVTRFLTPGYPRAASLSVTVRR